MDNKELINKTANTDGAAKKSFIQLIKFALVGASNTIVDMIVNIGVTKLLELITSGSWITYAAKTIGYGCGVLNSYILNSRWTFKEERKQDAKEIFSFIAVNVLVLLISLGLIWLFTNVLHLDDWWMNLGLPEWLTGFIGGRLFCSLVATVICIFVNFILNKLFVFTGRKEEEK